MDALGMRFIAVVQESKIYKERERAWTPSQ